MAVFKGVVSVTVEVLNGRTTSRTSFGSGRLHAQAFLLLLEDFGQEGRTISFDAVVTTEA